jgi:hypothetical protein
MFAKLEGEKSGMKSLSGNALALLVFLCANTAHATTSDFWWIGGNAGSTMQVYVDAPTIRQLDSFTKSAWITIIEEGKQAEDSKFTEERTKITFKCQDQKLSTEDIVEYKRDGSVTYSNSFPYQSFTDVVPNSVGSAELDFVCADPDTWEKMQNVIHIIQSPMNNADMLYRVLATPQRHIDSKHTSKLRK